MSEKRDRTSTPLGYSLCGTVVEVGRGAEEFRAGQLVAAAGNEYALHAEYNWVPINLCAAVPKGVAPQHAAFSTVGAIAMHGVRRAEVQLGWRSAGYCARLLRDAAPVRDGVDPDSLHARRDQEADHELPD